MRVDLPHLLMENKLIGCTVMINQAVRRILQGSSLPQNARFHDGWLGLIAAAFGKISFIKEPTILYRQHENNIVGDKGFISYIASRVCNLRSQRAPNIFTRRRNLQGYIIIYWIIRGWRQ